MQHETAGHFTGQGFDALLVPGAAQSAGGQGFGLAPGENGRAVGAGENAHFHGQGADGSQVAAERNLRAFCSCLPMRISHLLRYIFADCSFRVQAKCAPLCRNL